MMPSLVYLAYALASVFVMILTQSTYIIAYLSIGYFIAASSMYLVSRNSDWNHRWTYNAQYFGRILILWPFFIIACIAAYMNSRGR